MNSSHYASMFGTTYESTPLCKKLSDQYFQLKTPKCRESAVNSPHYTGMFGITYESTPLCKNYLTNIFN